jgi:hypothetical protein
MGNRARLWLLPKCLKVGLTSHEYLWAPATVSNAGLHMTLRGCAAPQTAAWKANVAVLEKAQTEWKRIEQELVRLAESTSKPKG